MLNIDLFLNCLYIFGIVLMLYGVFYVGQLVVERFVLQTVPIIAEVYLRLRHPERYRDK